MWFLQRPGLSPGGGDPSCLWSSLFLVARTLRLPVLTVLALGAGGLDPCGSGQDCSLWALL